MTCLRVLIVLAALALSGFIGSAHAVQACAWDHRNFCGEWGIGSNGLNNCMRRNGGRLSDGCVRALIAAGKVSRAEVDRRRVKYGR